MNKPIKLLAYVTKQTVTGPQGRIVNVAGIIYPKMKPTNASWDLIDIHISNVPYRWVGLSKPIVFEGILKVCNQDEMFKGNWRPMRVTEICALQMGLNPLTLNTKEKTMSTFTDNRGQGQEHLKYSDLVIGEWFEWINGTEGHFNQKTDDTKSLYWSNHTSRAITSNDNCAQNCPVRRLVMNGTLSYPKDTDERM